MLKLLCYDALDPKIAITVKDRCEQILNNISLHNPWKLSNNDSTFNGDENDPEASNVQTSQVMKLFNELQLKSIIKKIDISFSPNKFRGSSKIHIWLNRYKKDEHWQEPHTHFYSDEYCKKYFDSQFNWLHRSFVYFIQVDESKPCFYFYNDGIKKFINEKNNSIIVFPSETMHGVDINRSEKQRITMAGNISFAMEKS